MNLHDGIKHEGAPFCIPDCKRVDLPYFFRDLGFKTGAEIGVYYGRFNRWFCRRGFKMFGVDAYLYYKDEVFGPRDGNQRKQDEIYERAVAGLAQYDFTLIRKMSMDAVKQFEDGSLDFVYIDGNHDLKYVMEDIWCWSRKVRPGGIVSGHDYDLPGMTVKVAVHAYTEYMGIKNWWVLGREEYIPGEAREPQRSWMWFNK